ncbi:killer cell lectin-like receptor subfamily I member 1 [Peromyscus californicus insignis]|uniref:killer cell lectin-like receptor subfamily I member 1 n=1 Tax=Peromyscus californicus insignis TaxID=564181 RepID=UPI0022A6C732|nr:killer cell lectin-like receptor subfamily I member 1 [Peromyscus californicus insignis]
MPHSKHDEYTANKQDIAYTEIKMTKSPQKQRIPKAEKRPILLSEEQVNYAELTFHRMPELLPQKRVVGGERQATVWRMVTGILGALCVVLMTVVGILLPKLFSSQEQSRKILLHPLLCPKENNSSCDLCSHDWIAFGNNFYRGFQGIKSWVDSQSACKELNSHLLEIDSKAELENMLLFEFDGWILLKIDETEVSWQWENATKTEQTRINDSEKNHSCHYLKGTQIYSVDCSSKKPYTCEFKML